MPEIELSRVQYFGDDLQRLDDPRSGPVDVLIAVDDRGAARLHGAEPLPARIAGEQLGVLASSSASSTARSRAKPQGLIMIASGSAASRSSHSNRSEGPRGAPITGAPPASSTCSIVQCPAVMNGSAHSITAMDARGSPAARSATESMRRHSAATSAAARSGTPSASPTLPMSSRISVSAFGASGTSSA